MLLIKGHLMEESLMLTDEIVSNDAIQLMCGKLLGKGGSRWVYENRFDKSTVIKLQYGNGLPMQNILEWQVWLNLQHEEAGKWLAPCFMLSNRGHVLVQAKTELISFELYPLKIPCFLTDTKYENFGKYQDRFVCHDFGSTLLMTTGSRMKMKKALWYEAYPSNN